MWSWQLMPKKGYTISMVYLILNEAKPNTRRELHEIILNKSFPLKVSFLCGDFFRTKFLQRIIWLSVEFFNKI